MSKRRGILAIGLVVLLSACSLPRGAAIESEIVKAQEGQGSEDYPFGVETVTRDDVHRLNKWPVTGWGGYYHWFPAQKGPSSSIIRPGDQLELTVWDNQANSLLIPAERKQIDITKIAVSASGEVFLPYVGTVQVSGLTPDRARERLQEELEAITPSAQVQLELVSGPANTADLVGGVSTPGRYPLPDRNYNLLSLIAEAGGIDPGLRYPIVRLIRDSRTYEIPADALLADASANVTMRGRDQVVVVEDERYFIALGATGSEKQVFFEQEKITALEAVSLVGGINDTRANPQGILILREYPTRTLRKDGSGPSKEQTIFVVDLTSADGLFAARNFQIHPQDTVLATESAVTSIRTVLGLIGAAFGISNAL